MDSYEATRAVFSRIQNLDPENASKIMGYILIQDHGEKEMIRLAFGPETLLHNLILNAKTHFGISTNTSPSSSPSPFNHISRPSPLSINNGAAALDTTKPSSPSSTPWFPDLRSPSSTSPSLSYANIVNGTTSSGPLSSTFIYNNNSSCSSSINGSELIDEYHLQDHLSFLNDAKHDELFELAMSPTTYGETNLHRRSYSVPGMCFGPEDANSGFGWKPCLYFARGFCKNGSSCRFLHGDSSDGVGAIVGSPNNLNEFEQCHELLRSKSAQQQKVAAASQFIAGAASFPYNKSMNFLLQQQNDTQRSAAASLIMGDELHKFGRCGPDRSDFSAMGLGGMVNPGSRQIYLTFPADSTFREEDVSIYFSIYGPVQDVRIPYQQKRMFGFVTFLYPETVKLILAKGNPHFVCDSRVLVKPYKEKGKVPDKKQQQQQLERGDYSGCSTPSGLDSREPYDLHLGARMFYNTHEMLRRKLEEQADLQQAIELQGRRLMNLQLLDLKNRHHHQYHHGLSSGSPIPSPTLPHTPNNQVLILPDGINQEIPEGNGGGPTATISKIAIADNDHQLQQDDVNATCSNINGNDIGKDSSNTEETDLQESLEHILPDSLFASPKKSAGGHLTVFSTSPAEGEEKTTSSTSTSSANNNNQLLAPTSTLNMTSLKSCFLQVPRFSSGHGTIGM